jgi:uncharacterized protein (DUF924 family)
MDGKGRIAKLQGDFLARNLARESVNEAEYPLWQRECRLFFFRPLRHSLAIRSLLEYVRERLAPSEGFIPDSERVVEAPFNLRGR